MLSVAALPSITRLRLPRRYEFSAVRSGLVVRRLLTPQREVNGTLEAFRSRGENCRRVLARMANDETLLIEFGSFGNEVPQPAQTAIRLRPVAPENGILSLLGGVFRNIPTALDGATAAYDAVCTSWRDGIQYRAEVVDAAGQVARAGLRTPQIGALHAIASFRTLLKEPALIVMPTGTGKTEVILAHAVASASPRLLVVVPTDALRQQTADRFESYGILPQLRVCGNLPPPVIGLLSSQPSDEHLEDLRRCNVVISTMASIGLADEPMQRRFAALFSHVVFDEAHHMQAATWKRFQEQCSAAEVLLFTATPFREDGKAIPGRMIYNYPLSEAQRLGYFRPISFIEVFEPNGALSDSAIAQAAVGRLRQDLNNGLDHILLARAGTIDAANVLHRDVYAARFPELHPVVIHSRTPGRRAVLDAIREGRHRVVVCVDMFGEGVDLPQLKVAALHSIHKSLGITLQFIGRFARSAAGVGSASFVANTAEDGVPEALDALYREDSDWNLLLPDLSYDAIDPQAQLSELVANLEPVGDETPETEVSTLTLRPKCSAQVYRTAAFHPDDYATAFPPSHKLLQPLISRQDKVLILIVNQQERPDWTDSRDILVDSWDLYIAYYDEQKQLLYVHSSRKGDATSRLARSISTDPALIQGEEAFRVFGGLRRLTLYSVGLSSRSRNVRFQLFAGLDVRNAIDPVQQQSKLKSLVTGVGYEEGERQSVGCSRKGKIWSVRSGTLADWVRWCDMIGTKLSNTAIAPNDFLRHTLIPSSVAALPACRALMVDWPDQLFESSHFGIEVFLGDASFAFDECQLDLLEWTPGGTAFTFKLTAGTERFAIMRLELTPDHGDDGYGVTRLQGDSLEVSGAGSRLPMAEFFSANPPLVRLEDGSQLAGSILLKPREALGQLFDPADIRPLDWTGVDITKESRWRNGAYRADSVQQKFVEHLEAGPATFIIDDDDTGESADIVAIEELDDRILVHLWHCKFSSGADPGHRLDDLYVVCGQAQKSVKWTWNLRTLIAHIIKREGNHRGGRPSRFLRGSLAELATLRKAARRKFVDYRIGIVQPGLTRAAVTNEQLSLLGASNSLVQCITDSPLAVVGSV